MTAHAAVPPVVPSLGRRALVADALFCAAAGAACLAGAGPLAAFLGLAGATPLALAGAGIVGYAALLFRGASRDPLPAGLLRAIALLNTAWVVASIALIAANPLGLTTGGLWAVGILAAIVGDFGLVQWYALRRGR
jgi:hypothetical protein